MEAALHAGSLLAAERHQPLSENSRLGHQLPTVALHPGIGLVNSNTATGLRVCLYDEGRGSRCTGKERDSESGLDYFGARYYGSALGRFTSVDPEGASASLFDPQRWNGYSYPVNNPYKFVDRDGEVPVLLVTAAIGAGVGAVGGAAFDITNQLIQNGWDFSAINGREVAGATVGGLVSGGLAGSPWDFFPRLQP